MPGPASWDLPSAATPNTAVTEISFEKMQILGNDPAVLDQALEWACNELQARALETRNAGILATRHAPGHFTLELSPDVPFGYTHEAG